MLTGRHAKFYRTLSKVSAEDLAELLDPYIISRVEDENNQYVPNETITEYYAAVNRIKMKNASKTVEKIESMVGAELPPPKTTRKRQPKTKN